ncbi:MAG: arginine--tRNA ligase [Patescibacteria group bacterium]
MHIRFELQKMLQELVGADALKVKVERPSSAEHGDYATSIALALGKQQGIAPQQAASQLVEKLKAQAHPAIGDISIAGPGFMNLRLSDAWLTAQGVAAAKSVAGLGKSMLHKGEHAHLEFISANPTGPLTLANARGGFLGDVLGNVLQRTGYKVVREFYVNDRGNQVGVLAESVLRRYWQQQGITIDYPETCYQGAYVDELARKLKLANYRMTDVAKIHEIRDKIKDKVVATMLKEIQRVVTKTMGITFDNWLSEKALVASGVLDKLLAKLKDQGMIYEKEGATWLATTKYGDDKDRVLVKADGEMAYFLPDIANHWLKFTKHKANVAINILGADHHGYVARMRAAMQGLGFDNAAHQFHPIIIQFVRLLQDGKEVKMSKRRGTYVEAEEVVEEVGLDAARFFFLMYDPNTHLDFNLDAAKAQNEKNPVYYVQYAHARMCSIIAKTKGLPVAKTPVGVLPASARRLILELLRWPEVLEDVSRDYGVQRIPQYALDLARTFHDFYTNVRVIDNEHVQSLPFTLVRGTKNVLADVLDTLGITAPAHM